MKQNILEKNKKDIESERIKFLTEMVKKEIPDSGPIYWIKNENTLIISGEFIFNKNINSGYRGIYNFLKKSKEYFKNVNWEDKGEGVSADLINPIGNVSKVVICITKGMD